MLPALGIRIMETSRMRALRSHAQPLSFASGTTVCSFCTPPSALPCLPTVVDGLRVVKRVHRLYRQRQAYPVKWGRHAVFPYITHSCRCSRTSLV